MLPSIFSHGRGGASGGTTPAFPTQQLFILGTSLLHCLPSANGPPNRINIMASFTRTEAMLHSKTNILALEQRFAGYASPLRSCPFSPTYIT